MSANSFYTNKRVLVTGGCGLIGSYLVDLLVKDGAKVTVADNLSRIHVGQRTPTGNQNTLVFTLLQLDLSDYENCVEACSGQDIVFNLAAKVTGILYNQKHQTDMFFSNMLLQQNVIKAAAEVGVERLLQVSTACVYPNDAAIPTPESEGSRGTPEPTNIGYGWAKRMGEELARWYAQETNMKVAIARPFNAYGLRDNFEEEHSHVIPAIIKRVFDGHDPLVVWGTGNQSRAFVHARDVAMGMKLVLQNHAVAEPVNIGHDEEISIRDLTQLILKIVGKSPKIVFDTSKPDGYPRRANDVTLLKKISGGWTPQTKLEDGIREMVEWFRENYKPQKQASTTSPSAHA